MRRGAVRFGAAVIVAGLAAFPALASHDRGPVDCPGGDCDIPWAWDDNRLPSQDNPPLPEGFVLTVQVPPAAPSAPAPQGGLSRYPQVADALGRCWDPSDVVGDRHWGAITVRVSFKRDGSVNGVPRITYVDRLADRSIDADLRRSLLSALGRCTPLPFSGSLGRAIAGQIFTIRFVQKGTST